MISFVFIILAAICNAIMDVVCQHHNTSIFQKYKIGFWSDAYLESWKNKYIDGDPKRGRVKWYFGLNKPVQITDAFHFFKMLMIICICLSIITFTGCGYVWYYLLLELVIYGTLWNISFSLFYDKILKK